jgi:ketosteroid isomerase-like protein
MTESTRLQVARRCYAAYESGDREAAAACHSADLRFSSPADVDIDRARYFERCWPNTATIAAFGFVRLQEIAGDGVLVTYEAQRTDGSRFRNTEILTFREDLICAVEVYFGWNLG